MIQASLGRNFISAFVVGALVSGCAVSPGSTASPDRSTSTTQTAAASPAPALRLVAIGDSTAAATLCECARFPDVYGQLAAQALGQPVRVQNLAAVRTTSSDLLDAVEANPTLRAAIQEADIITITIGINDINPCGAETDRACYDSAIAGLQTNLEALLREIDTLQGDHPHTLRATAYYNFKIGNPVAAQLGPSFQAFYAEQLASLNGAICEAVAAHDGLCVDLLPAFNGTAGDQDAASLLVDDHIHPSREGHEAIAQELAAAGFAPLSP